MYTGYYDNYCCAEKPHRGVSAVAIVLVLFILLAIIICPRFGTLHHEKHCC